MSTASFRGQRNESGPTSLRRPHQSDTPQLGYTHGWTRLPFHPKPASHPLRSTSGESEHLAGARATAPGTNPADPPHHIGLRAAAGMSERQTLRCSFLRVWAFALLNQVTAQLDVIFICRSLCRRRNPRRESSPSKCSGPATKHNALLCRTGLFRPVTASAPNPAPRTARASSHRHR